MSKFAGVVGGPVLGAAAAASLVLGVALILGDGKEAGAPQQVPAGQVQSEPDAAPDPQKAEPGNTEQQTAAADPADLSEQAESQAAPAMPEAPSIDTFRLDPGGALLVAGQAEPGWQTSVTLDGRDLETVDPDGAGKFVAFLQIEQSDHPRILSLTMRDPDGGAEIASRDEVIIAPTPAPEPEAVTAQAAPEASEASGDAPEAAPAETTAETTAETPPDAGTEAHAGATPATPEGAASDPVSDTVAPSQTVLLSNDDGVRVLQPATPRDMAPEVMSSVALDAITYSQEGEVQLSGRGQGEGFVRVYLDNAPVTTSRITEDGNWRTDLPQVDTGVYTLRIDETDAQGNVTSRVETPFKREDEEVIASASGAVAEQRIAAVTVQPGSTLWAISRAAYGDGVLYVRVFEANRDRIRDPDLIYPGQVFNLPE